MIVPMHSVLVEPESGHLPQSASGVDHERPIAFHPQGGLLTVRQRSLAVPIQGNQARPGQSDSLTQSEPSSTRYLDLSV